MRERREKGSGGGREKERDRQREVVSGELGEDCHESGKRKEKMTGTKRGMGEGGRRAPRKMDGGGQERGSWRTGRINKRNAPPSHLRHLYFAAPHGRKSSSVSERGGYDEAGEREGRAGSAAGKGSRPPSLALAPDARH